MPRKEKDLFNDYLSFIKQNDPSEPEDIAELLRKDFDSELLFDGEFDDDWCDNPDSIDNDIRNRSEDAYIEIAKNIVRTSTKQLQSQNKSKNQLKKIFTIFFIAFISTQYLVLVVLLFFKGFFCYFSLSDTLVITYISSLFVETLSAIIIMIKYAFDSVQENQIVAILSGIISEYQKYSNQK